MKPFGQRIALALVGGLLWVLAVAHPVGFLYTRDGGRGSEPRADDGARFVSKLSSSAAIADRLRDTSVAGYVSEGPIDTRAGGPLESRYYLAQYALAPTLLDPDLSQLASHEFVLGCFRSPNQLDAFLDASSRTVAVSISSSIALTRPRGP